MTPSASSHPQSSAIAGTHAVAASPSPPQSPRRASEPGAGPAAHLRGDEARPAASASRGAPGPSPLPERTRFGVFRLSRYFNLASLLGIAAIVVVLSLFYRHLAFSALMHHEQRANAALAQAFANSVWPAYAGFAESSIGKSASALANSNENTELKAAVMREMRGLPIAKVKVYNAAGVTIFSTDAKQIGEDKRANAGFVTALNGSPISEIVFRDRFDAFEGVLERRNLVSSYVPIRRSPGRPVEAVLEVYSDVTELVQRLETTQRQIIAGVLASLALLYLFLFLIVRRADRIIREQEKERQANEARITFQAYHDSLTGLPNRASFGPHLAQLIANSSRDKTAMAVMFVDLDRFKSVNDTLGHGAGDALLQAVAKRIRSCIRGSDLLFRMGGDEFTVLLGSIAGRSDVAHSAQRILAALEEPFAIDDHRVEISASIGVTVFPTDGTTAGELINQADRAMYMAKEAGRDRFQFYRPDMDARVAPRGPIVAPTPIHAPA